MWSAPFLPDNPSCGWSAPSCLQAFLAAGLVADARDGHLVTQARRRLVEADDARRPVKADLAMEGMSDGDQ